MEEVEGASSQTSTIKENDSNKRRPNKRNAKIKVSGALRGYCPDSTLPTALFCKSCKVNEIFEYLNPFHRGEVDIGIF
ncbi:hypothetical protein NPIL_75741 [Nephila pilipes]|uniref:Uncharacterized protein n=1 Tax=Nephila pilipes TaxID=299642 RepID=A0A8X6PLN5_NEPPI|nr:hypothetical protein NPIL_75741 [Nephila pilipes]